MNIAQKIKMKNNLKVLCLGCFGVLLVSIIFQVYVSNKYAIKSCELVALQTKKSELEKETIELKKEITSLSCLGYIESKAAEHGFVKADSPFLTISPVTVAAVISER